MSETIPWTEERIDALRAGRELDVLVESRVMGRKVKFMKGAPCAWDGDKKPIMWGPDVWCLEDYDPQKDGAPLNVGVAATHRPGEVFHYSKVDLGMIPVMNHLIGCDGLLEVGLVYKSDPKGWEFSVRFFDPAVKMERVVHGRDPVLASMAVYRGALKAVIL